MADINELREQRSRLIKEARESLDKAEAAEKTGGSGAEHRAKFDELMDKSNKLADDIKRHETLREAERGNAQRQEQLEREQRGNGNPKTKEERQLQGFRTFIRSGELRGDGAEEFRALQQDIDSSGGFLTVPMQFMNELIVFVKDLVFIRAKATVTPVTSAASLGTPTLESDPDDADWTSELDTGNDDTGLKFGRRDLKPHPLAKRIRVSRKLLAIAALNPEGIIRDRLGYKFAVSEEKAFLTGTGANQPLGLFTASPLGISTARDVSTGNTATALQFDGIIEAKYKLKAQYQRTAEWIFHRDAVKQIAKLKDGDGQYIWQASKTADDPDMLLGRPVNMSEYAPNTFTTGQYVGMFGNFGYYHIADALSMDIQRLNELYAATNQVGFIMRKETDGMPVLEEAFARVQLA
jgi:HK97 family phage major capsid protein